ncbi:MAG: xylulokinase, partial [Acidimicrobiia bacterium]|nr:xylulokinase [Acidimicrobiia bacterium]
MLVAGVDCSTGATKVELRSVDDGRLVGTGRAAHPTTQPPRSEQDPAAWWAAQTSAMTPPHGATPPAGVHERVAALSVGG